MNIYNFCSEWIDHFYNHPEIWPKGHKHKSENYDKYRDQIKSNSLKPLLWKYDYKQKSNLFGLDSLYRDMPKKSFIRGKKQYLEAIMMHCWLHEIDGEISYWDNYLDAIYPNL